MLFVLVVFFLVSYGLSSLLKSEPILENKIVMIPVQGTIATGTDLFNQEIADPSLITDFIKQANEQENVKAIILEINSPGGTVVASQEIARAVRQSKKPVVAYIREVGASGAYWVASASDKIVAEPLSITGSIGVYSGYLEFSGLFEKYGVTYVDLKSGEYKDTGTPFKELSSDERKILENKLKIIHSIFISEVSNNRNIPINVTKQLSTGIYYLGIEAKEFGLVDYLGDEEKAISVAKELANITDASLVRYKQKSSFFDLFNKLTMSTSYNIGRGIASELDFKAKESYLSIRT